MAGCLEEFGYPDEPVRLVSARDHAVNLKQSVKIVVEHYIRLYGLGDDFDIQAQSITHLPTGSLMTFPGVKHGEAKFLLMEGLDIFWMEQAEILKKEEMQIIEPTMRKRGSELWFSWNPYKRTDWVWMRFVSQPRPGDVSLEANWRDNPWWEEMALEQMRRDWEEFEPDTYAWVWEGKPNDADAATAVLPYSIGRLCVQAYEKYAAKHKQGIQYAGLDLAEGGKNKCALVVRDGPCVEHIHQWPGVPGDLSQAAATAWDQCQEFNKLVRIYYDGSSPARTDLQKVGFKGVRPVNFGGAVGGPEVLSSYGTRVSDSPT